MKSIKDLREQYQVITEKEDKEQRKLTALVRAGLFDAKKLPMLKRALEKGVDKMTPAEKKILIDLLDSLMNQVVSNEPVYMKVKRNVQSVDEEIIAEAVKKPLTVTDIPSIVILKRKAVRVYPGGHQVGLYYSQQIDKYVTIPFGEAGISDLSEAANQPNPKPRIQYIKKKKKKNKDRISKLMDRPYQDLSPDEQDALSPMAVAAHAYRQGYNMPSIATGAILAHLLKNRSRGSTASKKVNPSAYKNLAKSIKSIKPLGSAGPTSSTATMTKPAQSTKSSQKSSSGSVPIRKKSSAQTKAAMSKTLAKNPKATFSKGAMRNAQIKEAVILKLIERQQLYEYSAKDLASDAADIAIPGVSAYKNLRKGNYGAAALDAAIDVGSVAAAPFTFGGSLVGRAALKGAIKGGAKLATKGAVKKGTLLRNLKAKRLKNIRKGRKGKSGRLLDIDLGGSGGGNYYGGGGSSGPIFDRSKFAKDVVVPKGQGLDIKPVGPEGEYTKSRLSPARQTQDDNLQRQANRAMLREYIEVDLDGNLFEINNNIAEKLINVYESLNNNNKQKMVDMLMNEETQNKILEFVRRY